LKIRDIDAFPFAGIAANPIFVSLNTMMRFLFISGWMFLSMGLLAQRGKQGPANISTANTIVNEYTTLIADAAPGDQQLLVSASGLNANNRFPNTLQPGDLLLIIQIQGASISGGDNPDFGQITNYNNCGNYEYAEVRSVGGPTTINLLCGLQKGYTASGKVQVVRVPRFQTLSIASTGSVTAPSWDGNTGGIVAIETNQNLSFTGSASINVSARGFRGGIDPTTNVSAYGVQEYATVNPDFAAQKGESIAGWVAEYDAVGGRLGRGAAANGGGGGNAHNHGGGGGANAGDPFLYNGLGNPDISNASWIQAWNLESPGFANNVSSGGGRGGYSFSGNNQNALTTGPGNSSWGGDLRSNNGGRGGRPLDYSSGRLFMGGGGGAGEENADDGGDGGIGGGIVLLRVYGNLTGTGAIRANGGSGGNAQGSIFNGGKDAAGGGGGGGAVVVECVGTLSAISIEARGGNGGNQYVPINTNEAEGPGGGGGGGYVALSASGPVVNVSGGNNGTTDSAALTEFIPNGATRGGAGISAVLSPLHLLDFSQNTLCGPGNAILTASAGTASPNYQWSSILSDPPLFIGNPFTQNISTNQNYWLTACGLAQTIAAQAIISETPTVNAGSDESICFGNSVTLNGQSNGSVSWSNGIWLSDPFALSTIAQPDTSVAFVLTASLPNGCAASDTVVVNVLPQVDLTAPLTVSVCEGNTVLLTAQSSGQITWSGPVQFSTTSGNSTTVSASASADINLQATAPGFCEATATVGLTVFSLPQVNAGTDQSVCPGGSLTLSGSGDGLLSWAPNPFMTDLLDMNPVVSPSSNTQFILQALSQEGCSRNDTVNISIGNGLSLFLSADTAICAGSSVTLTASGGAQYEWLNSDYLDNPNSPTPVASPVETTVFIVSATDVSGLCAAQDSVRIEVYPQSNLSISGGGLFCDGEGVEIAVSGAQSVIWTPTEGLSDPASVNPLANPLAETNYSAVYVDQNGCSGDAGSVTVIPGVPALADFSFEQISNYEVVFSSPGQSGVVYNWQMNGATLTGDTVLYNFPFDNVYSITLIANSACGADTLVRTIEVLKLVGFEPVVHQSIAVYPNPANEIVWFELPESVAGNGLLQVFDLSGRCVWMRETEGHTAILAAEYLARGLYQVVWSSGGKMFGAKLQLQ
jgi:hypothetical protein